MATKFNPGDRVRVKPMEFFMASSKNPYSHISSLPDRQRRLAEAAGEESKVIEVHPAGFVRLAIDAHRPNTGTFTYDMIELVSKAPTAPLVEPKTHPAGTEFPIQEAAIATMAGMLANHAIIPHDISDEQAQKIAKNVLILVKALELELQ